MIHITDRTSRGIGLEITKQLLQSSNAIVLVASRSTSEVSVLKDIATFAGKHLHVLRLDVNDAQSIKDVAREAAEIVGEKGIDYLINNAGIVSALCLSSSHRFSLILSRSCGRPAATVEPRRARHRIHVYGRGPDIGV